MEPVSRGAGKTTAGFEDRLFNPIRVTTRTEYRVDRTQQATCNKQHKDNGSIEQPAPWLRLMQGTVKAEETSGRLLSMRFLPLIWLSIHDHRFEQLRLFLPLLPVFTFDHLSLIHLHTGLKGTIFVKSL